MCAHVILAGSQSSSIPVVVGVKLVCVLTPIILNLFLVPITPMSHHDFQLSDRVGVEYHLDGGLFNLRCLQSKTKTSSALISTLHYTDDATFPCLTADELQHSLNLISETYHHVGLIVNTRKTEVFNAS